MPTISPEQFQAYQQQQNQPVENGDLVGQRQKTNATYWLAYCYENAKEGVDGRDEEQAVQILEKAIQEQDHMDDNNLHDNTGKHRYFLAGLMSLRRNQQRANLLYHQAFQRLGIEVQEGGNDENFQEAAFDLGTCLFHGRGVDEDPSRGIHWWKAAAEHGHELAQIYLLYLSCREPYVTEVFDWWLVMAGDEHGHAWAQMALGKCYGYGRGVKKDLVKAVEWYNKAISQGYKHAIATYYKRKLLDGLSPEERKTLGCVARNQKIEKAKQLIEQFEPDSVPLGLWPHAIATFQHQENPPWESPSPTFLSLIGGIIPLLQCPPHKQKRQLPLEG